MQEIIQDMRSNGFEIDSLALDGKIHRFGDKKKSNWYVGFRNYTRQGGEPFVVVKYGSWKTGDVFLYQSNADYSAEDKASIKKQIDDAKKKAEEERLRVQSEVAEELAQFWETLDDSEITPYMQRKQIRQHFGTRAKGSQLFVPLRDVEGRLWGLQRIQPDGGKFFAPGQRVAGLFHTIGSLDDADAVFVCEGFATGAAIYQATERCVAISFNGSNLVSVAAALHSKFPQKRFLICGDDDQWTTRKVNGNEEPWNPGREYATKAAQKIMCEAVFPKFSDLEGRPTDFNDLFVREGVDSVRALIAPGRARSAFVVPLGFREKEYFFTSSSNKQIVGIKSFSDVEFFNLMPQEYWENCFPGMKGGIDFPRAKSELMQMCRDKGIFQTRNVRGAGVWLDDGRIVVNHGDHLIVDGVRMDLQDIKSKFFYTLGKKIAEIPLEPLSLEECELIVNISETFKWQKRDFGKLMSGALIVQKLCGALPVRPHVWLTGGSQTGKTTLLERLIFPTLKSYSLYFLGGTSEAGLRQSLGSDSIPVIFDEFETNGQRSSEMIQACVELMRSSWSESHGVIAKGSANGNAQFYQPRFSALVSSIRVNLQNDADRSRFTQIELAPHGSDPEHWKFLKSLLDLYDKTYVDRLFVRSIRHVKNLLANYETLRSCLAQRVGARFGQQYGMLLAGWSILKFDTPLTRAQALEIVNGLELTEESDEAKLTDELELVSFIATKKMRLQGGEEVSVSEAIQRSQHPMSGETYVAALERVGLKLVDQHVAVANRHTELGAILKDTRWSSCWPKTLARLDGAQKNVAQRYSGKVLKATKVPLHFFA